MLMGKNILLGVSSSIACYKSAMLASQLTKQGCHVNVVMTKNAVEFINPLTFESVTGNRACVDTFDRNFQREAKHISLADAADLVVIAPASANVIARLAHGIADDLLTTTVLAADCPKIAAPAMNFKMYGNPVTQDNIAALRRYGWEIAGPGYGRMANGGIGQGRMLEPDQLFEVIDHAISHEKDMAGMHVLVTAGPTCEAIDPVRYITNHSTGRMGYAIARRASARGAQVTLVSGPTSLEKPSYVDFVPVVSAADMFDAVTSRQQDMDIIIKAAAVADYRPENVSDEKIKKQDGNMAIPLTRTKAILAYLGEHKKDGQFICGFSMETEHMVENSKKKLEKKHIDMVAANNLKVEGAGFGVDTNIMTLITKEGEKELPLMSKEDVANAILDEIVAKIN